MIMAQRAAVRRALEFAGFFFGPMCANRGTVWVVSVQQRVRWKRVRSWPFRCTRCLHSVHTVVKSRHS